MATRTSRSTGRRPAARRTPARKAVRARSGTAARKPAKRAAKRAAPARAIKLVIETRNASPMSRIDGTAQVLSKPGKAKL